MKTLQSLSVMAVWLFLSGCTVLPRFGLAKVSPPADNSPVSQELANHNTYVSRAELNNLLQKFSPDWNSPLQGGAYINQKAMDFLIADKAFAKGDLAPSLKEDLINHLKLGLELKGLCGEPIKSIGQGKLIYEGNDLQQYGNLVIIKHDNGYISIYGNNQHNIVTANPVDPKTGRSRTVMVTSGEKIATMGNSSKAECSTGSLFFLLKPSP